jgi:hypothetical protein
MGRIAGSKNAATDEAELRTRNLVGHPIEIRD